MHDETIYLGVHMSHDAGAALLRGGEILAVVAEERLSRRKHQRGFPRLAIQEVLRIGGVEARDVGVLAITGKLPGALVEGEIVPAPETVPRHFRPSRLRLARRKLGAAVGYSTDWSGQLFGMGLDPDRAFYVEHHLCHAATAYYTSGWDRAICITVDGYGDDLSATVGLGDGEALSREYICAQRDSIGSFYQAVTEALGFQPIDGENKTMGLACFGDPERFHDELAQWIYCDEDGRFQTRRPWTMRPISMFGDTFWGIAEADAFRSLLKTEQDRYDLAAGTQRLVEELMLQFVQGARRRLGEDLPICASGGVMLNVKVNKLVHERLGVEDYYIFPDSGDAGNALGAALYARRLTEGKARVGRLASPYLGPDYSREEIGRVLAQNACRLVWREPEASYAESVVDLLGRGSVVGWFQGRMEMGPRALGARSVLADPRRAEVKERINTHLKKRDWFVPFAPSGLDEDLGEYLEGYRSEPFMTKAFDVRPAYRDVLPAITHVDGTARPQGVRRGTNPRYYELLETAKRRWGVPIVLNTSFNRHGLPIVAQPEHAVEHLLDGNVDVLAIGPYLVARAEDGAVLAGGALEDSGACAGSPVS